MTLVFASITTNTMKPPSRHTWILVRKISNFLNFIKFLVYFPLAQSAEWLGAVGKYCSVIGRCPSAIGCFRQFETNTFSSDQI